MYSVDMEMGLTRQILKGKTASDIVLGIYEYHDIASLSSLSINMSPSNDNKKELEKLADFVKKYCDKTLDMDDIRNLDIRLGWGDFRCHGIMEENAEED